ncbi:conjugal transfer protein [Streptococcus anginosus]|uniref:conjugal transfer protein n=1 Tax=Streptococcus anginosus TaxID=1328 RepID=UPI00195BF55D|nr:conjugal transfer protein [Streptococcus anginosus]
MEEERLYDYARGINAPYWIQEVKTQKGKRIWYFATPMQLSFFVVFALVLILMLTVFNSILLPLNKLTHSISLYLYWYIPYKLAKFYTEYEPQGKKMHIFLWDYLCYMIDFRFNRKAIYHEDRMKMIDDEEIVFEKTDL